MFQLMDTTHVGPVALWWSGRDLRRRARRSLPGSDEEVLRRVARGDGDALAVLHHRCGDLVHANVRRVLRDPALAEQVTEQVFDDLATLACRFDPSQETARMWLLALAHDRAITCGAERQQAPRSVASREPATTS